MSLFSKAAQLRKILIGMEHDLGFEDLSDSEKSILYAVVDLDVGHAVQSSLIKAHILTDKMTKPTFHRALKSLVSKGYLAHEIGTKVGLYRLGNSHQ